MPANPFVEMEAEEGDDEESEGESESPPRNAFAPATTQPLTASHPSDEESSESIDLDDSFICGDDCFD